MYEYKFVEVPFKNSFKAKKEKLLKPVKMSL